MPGYEGQFYIYNESTNRSLNHIITHVIPTKPRIFSFHWLSNVKCLTCETNGQLRLWHINSSSSVDQINEFVLPPSKERWSTAAAATCDSIGNVMVVVVGDRKGNLHLFKPCGGHQPIQTIKRAHSYLGITNLYFINDRKIVSLGRNSIVKTFSFDTEYDLMILESADKLPFVWLSGFDPAMNVLWGFSGDMFAVWDCKGRRILFEINCGGGHRSCDFTSSTSTFTYIKDKFVHVVACDLNSMRPIDIENGFHSKETNCLVGIELSSNKYVIVSGGEDTTLRISLLARKNLKTELSNLSTFKSHLSSIRTICCHKLLDSDCYLIFSAGGRAQIICWKLSIDDGLVCTSEQHSYYEATERDDSETRIMDLSVVVDDLKLCLFAACSDGNIKMFHITNNDRNDRYRLIFVKNIFYKLRCIMKIDNFRMFDSNILITMATDGHVVFWNNPTDNDDNFAQFHTIDNIHQSGINSYSFRILSTQNRLLLLTGGDDNAFVLTLLQFSQQIINNVTGSRKEHQYLLQIKAVDSLLDTRTHSAQITGVFLYSDYFLTASIDQKLTVHRWFLFDDDNNQQIMCENKGQYNSTISDIQGMECLVRTDNKSQSLLVCVYGKGVEFVDLFIANC